MELVAVRTARFIAAISTEELNPRGLVIYPSLIEALVEKYNFDTYPSGDDELDETAGIEFENGNWNGTLISKVTIFGNGIVIDTRSSTKDSEAIFNEAMQWTSESVGLTYHPSMVTSKIYVSELVVRTKVVLNNLNPALQSFGEQLSKSINSHTGLNVTNELGGLVFYFDTSAIKAAPPPFRIERLGEVAYSENKYYSMAPIHTEEHLEFLEQLENILTKSS